MPLDLWDKDRQTHWFTPASHSDINVLEWLVSRCDGDAEVHRVAEEWVLFEAKKMEPVLRFLIYMVEHFRENKILWGVGRGSSVSSYCLFLIGVHRINSLKFDLDYREFLK
jgi:DNA polymerase III alpha subunit